MLVNPLDKREKLYDDDIIEEKTFQIKNVMLLVISISIWKLILLLKMHVRS